MDFISKIFRIPQKFVDKIGMYRVVSGSLALLAFISIVAGFTGIIAYSGVSQIVSLLEALILALFLNVFWSKILRIPVNHESAIITALILFFLVIPSETLMGNWPLWMAVAVGISSKFVITYRKQHIFNAAAFGAVVLSLSGLYVFSWWVANPVLFIPIIILGTIVVMKVRKWTPVIWFVGVSFVIYLFESWRFGQELFAASETFLLSWSTLFLAFFMLTEPFTLPPTKRTQALYGGLIGFLSNTAFFISWFVITPELALLLGNVFAYAFRIRRKLFLRLKYKSKIAKDTFELVFTKPNNFNFQSGQYLEWMFPHRNYDNRGVRRYFTIASSPTENELRLSFKKVEDGSSYKDALTKLAPGGILTATQLAGDFTLPKNASEKIGMIAGGIGITPFRSHIKYMQDSGHKYDTVLYYCCNKIEDIAFKEEFALVEEKMQFEQILVLAKEESEGDFEKGFVDMNILSRRTPDFAERIWYISGPPRMVSAYDKLMQQNGVPKKNIRTDFFPGLA